MANKRRDGDVKNDKQDDHPVVTITRGRRRTNGPRSNPQTANQSGTVSPSAEPDSDSDDEQELITAAAAWAAQDDEQCLTIVSPDAAPSAVKGKSQRKRAMPLPPLTVESSSAASQDDHVSSTQPPAVYSLHVTQLSYDATDFDVREHFSKAGCTVTSVRLVYDREMRTKTFRGVAFVDVADGESFQSAIHKLHGSNMLQRKINVRPVKTRQELAAIVKQTTDHVAVQIQNEKAKKKLKESSEGTKKVHASERKTNVKSNTKTKAKTENRDDSRKAPKRKRDDADQSPKKRSNEPNKSSGKGPKTVEHRDPSSPTSSSKKRSKSSPRNAKVSGSSTTTDSNSKAATSSKLTKQQRNRRAAILRSRRT